MKTSLEIAQAATLRPIADIAKDLGVGADMLEPYGKHVAKLDLGLIGFIEQVYGPPRQYGVTVSYRW